MIQILLMIVGIWLSVLSVHAETNIDKVAKSLFCEGDSIQLVEYYRHSIESGNAQPLLILADIDQIRDILGYESTIRLLHQLEKSITRESEKIFVKDVAQLFEEVYQPSFASTGNTHWYVVDNIKEPLPLYLNALYAENRDIRSYRHIFKVTQTSKGYIPLQQYTQSDRSLGCVFSSFQVHNPITIYISSNMEYVLYINGVKTIVNSSCYSQQLIRIVRIEPEIGFTCTIYYKPSADMFLKIVVRNEQNSEVSLVSHDTIYYQPISWSEVCYEIYTELLHTYTQQSTEDTLLSIALYYESLRSSTALQYYKDGLSLNSAYVRCRFLNSLLLYTANSAVSRFIIADMCKKNSFHEKYNVPLLRMFYNVFVENKINIREIKFLPLLIYSVSNLKERFARDAEDLHFLVEKYPHCIGMLKTFAEVLLHSDTNKAILLLQPISHYSNELLKLLMYCYKKIGRYDLIALSLATTNSLNFFYEYISSLIVTGKYDEAKRALFVKIAQGMDLFAYKYLAQIYNNQNEDDSLYLQKHKAIVARYPNHPEYMKEYFDHKLRLQVISHLAYAMINDTYKGHIYSCVGIRYNNATFYCTIYDVYRSDRNIRIKKYKINSNINNIIATVYLCDFNCNSVTPVVISGVHCEKVGEEVEQLLRQNSTSVAVVELSFDVIKDIPVFYLSIGEFSDNCEIDIATLSGYKKLCIHDGNKCWIATKNDIWMSRSEIERALQNSIHDKLIITAFDEDFIVEWLAQEECMFAQYANLLDINLPNANSVTEVINEIMQRFRSFSFIEWPYSASSLYAVHCSKKGTMLDAILYARYLLAMKGIISYIAIGNKTCNICGDQFDVVILYIPISEEKGIWIDGFNTYPSLDKLTITNVRCIVGNEVIVIKK